MSEQVEDNKPEEVKSTTETTTVVEQPALGATKEAEEAKELEEGEDLADLLAGKEDTDAILDAVKELTKIVGTLSKDLKQHMTAGKF